MRMTIQPLFLVMLLCIALSGHVATYSLILLSLLFHEFGHLAAAKCAGVRVRSCEIMPYGGEITFMNEYELTSKQSLIVALGGPVASLVGILIAFFLPEPIAKPLIHYQSIILFVNCLPFWPLDGGRIFYYTMLVLKPNLKIYASFLSLSLCFFTIIFLLALFLFEQYVLALLSVFLLIQVVKEWRLRKYRAAYEKIVLNRLT
ncbi:MAG: site-2 protease family protein [Solibacillus sp.]